MAEQIIFSFQINRESEIITWHILSGKPLLSQSQENKSKSAKKIKQIDSDTRYEEKRKWKKER